MKLNKLFPSQPPIEFTLEERLRVLGIDSVRLEKLYQLNYKALNIDIPDDNNSFEFFSMPLSNLLGYYRPDASQNKTWVDCLSNLPKMSNFTRYTNLEDFDSFMNCNYDDKLFVAIQSGIGLPAVVQYKNNYYISGNGKHRLTIAKCIGLKTASVIMKTIDCQ